MLKLLTDLITAERIDYPEDGVASVSGYQGSWVTLDSNSELTLTSTAAKPAYPIWNEGLYVKSGTSYTETVGFTDDVTETNKLTVLTGKHRAWTNQYTGTPAVGNILAVTATGVLSVQASPGDGLAVAVCTHAASSTVDYRGITFTCIQYETL